MTRKPPRSVLLVIVAVEVVAAAFAWRDLSLDPPTKRVMIMRGMPTR